jgi:hypothetical protein
MMRFSLCRIWDVDSMLARSMRMRIKRRNSAAKDWRLLPAVQLLQRRAPPALTDVPVGTAAHEPFHVGRWRFSVERAVKMTEIA